MMAAVKALLFLAANLASFGLGMCCYDLLRRRR